MGKIHGIIPCSEITPISDYGRSQCCFNCAECEYFGGLTGEAPDLEIYCNLEEEGVV